MGLASDVKLIGDTRRPEGRSRGGCDQLLAGCEDRVVAPVQVIDLRGCGQSPGYPQSLDDLEQRLLSDPASPGRLKPRQ